eukprot:392277-Pleurochrysis_carterae.AAC.2
MCVPLPHVPDATSARHVRMTHGCHVAFAHTRGWRPFVERTHKQSILTPSLTAPCEVTLNKLCRVRASIVNATLRP